jgi:hypothetical protein
MGEIARWDLHSADLSFHILFGHVIILKLSPLPVETPLDDINVTFNDTCAWMLAFVGHPGVVLLVLALMFLTAEVLRGGLFDGVEVPLWTPVTAQRALLHSSSSVSCRHVY